jgi:hypothetical protein
VAGSPGVVAVALGGTTFVRASLPLTILLLSLGGFFLFGAGILCRQNKPQVESVHSKRLVSALKED